MPECQGPSIPDDGLKGTTPSAAILIGGQARRMQGRVKAALPVGNRPILARQLDALRAAAIDRIVLIGRWTLDVPPPVPVIADAVESAGALGGVYTALLTATSDRVVVLAGDMPFVGAALIARVSMIEPGDDATVPLTAEGRHPLCAGYRRSIASHVKRRLDAGRLSVRDALSDLRVRDVGPDEIARIDPHQVMLTNVNTEEDYERAQARAAGSL